jgi:purine nucleosidase
MVATTKFACRILFVLLIVMAVFAPHASAQQKRKVIIDQDASGPGGTDMQAILALVNSPQTDVLGITVMTGDQWRDEEVAHTLRLLEIIGRTDIPVYSGATFPLVSGKEAIAQWEKQFGKVVYQGAWNRGKPVHGPWEIPPMPEGAPSTKAASEDAAHFLVRMVREYPHEITIYEGGPLTNLALAQTIDPDFASLAKELILMGGSIHPITDNPEFTFTPRREFNLWMDPEASHRVLTSPWARIVVTTVDISVKTWMDKALTAEIAKGTSASANYVAKYAQDSFLWDELAAVAWLDPSIITRSTKMYMDVSIDHGPTYGDTLVWPSGEKPALSGLLVEVQDDLNKEKFYKEFVELMTRTAPGANASVVQRGSGNSSTDSDAIGKLRAEWANDLRTKQLEQIAMLYTEDAVFMQPTGERLVGRAAIHELCKNIMATFTSDIELKAATNELSDNLAYESGSFSETRTSISDGKKIESSGAYVMMFRRQPSGSWLIAEQAWTGTEPKSR